jgi:hypothetical protein
VNPHAFGFRLLMRWMLAMLIGSKKAATPGATAIGAPCPTGWGL